MKVALYARVSTDEQNADKQIVELRKYCEYSHHEIVGEFSDTISGMKDSRPELDRLMKSVFLGGIEAVIIWKLDRLGRSLKHLISIVEQLEGKNIGLIVITQGFDTTKPEGKLFFHIFGAIAQFERELISARTKLGIKGTNVGKRGKDKGQRKKGGYYLRYMKQRKEA
jgi:DNA invertase Pin-like site-specific DNA recombinase